MVSMGLSESPHGGSNPSSAEIQALVAQWQRQQIQNLFSSGSNPLRGIYISPYNSTSYREFLYIFKINLDTKIGI